MSPGDLAQYALFLLLVFGLTVPAGRYLERVFSGEGVWPDRWLGPIERGLHRLMGLDPKADMDWKAQAWAFTLIGLVGAAGLFGVLMAQRLLPGPPSAANLPTPMTWDLALNTAVSFATGTTWQAYSGETTLQHAVQMLGLVTQGFLAGGAGLAVGMAFIRGFARSEATGLGNFWSDFIRSVLYVLLPLAALLALVLVGQGVVMTWRDHLAVAGPAGAQVLAVGPAAALESIKNLGTNGGGFFGVNGAHPFANPTPLTNVLGMLAIVALPAGLTHTFGRMTGRKDAGWMLFAVMALLFSLGLWGLHHAEAAPSSALPVAQVQGPNLEGKEVRFGLAQTVLAGVASSNGACGSNAAMHDSFSPLGSGIPLANMLFGEVAFGGLGTGLVGLLMAAVVAVFLAGLMIGRTPEYLGKTFGAREVKLAILYALVLPLAILVPSALALLLPAGRAGLSGNPVARQFTEVIFAYTSCAANNGQAMGGLSVNSPFWNVSTAVAMMLGRFATVGLALALAGSLVGQRRKPSSVGSLPAGSPLFGGLLFCTVVVVTGLSFLPAFVLGPVAERVAFGSVPPSPPPPKKWPVSSVPIAPRNPGSGMGSSHPGMRSSECRLLPDPQPIPHARFRAEVLRPRGLLFKFASQLGHAETEVVEPLTPGLAPHFLQEAPMGHDPTGMADERA
jgi:K+-transporting ATPase ATPase A chain